MWIHDFPGFLGSPGITVEKATKLFFAPTSKKSTERIRRVAELAKAGTVATPIDLNEEAPPQIIAHLSPLLVLFNCGQGVTALLCMPQRFCVAGVTQSTDYVSIEQLQSKACTIECKVLRAVVREADTGLGPAEIENSTDRCVFTTATATRVGGALDLKLTVNGLHVRPFDPPMTFDATGNVEWTVPLQDLWTPLQTAWAEVSKATVLQTAVGALPLLKENDLLITDARGAFTLVATGTEKTNPEDHRPVTIAAEDVVCELCGLSVESSMMRHHVAAHLLQENWSAFSKPKPANPCGLCGVRPAIGQHLADPSIANGCPVSLNKSGAAWRANHQCKYMGQGVKYSLGSAGNSTIKAPSSNRPLHCPASGCTLVVWSYNLRQHYETHHEGVQMSEATCKEVELRTHEAEWLKQLLTRKNVPASMACKVDGCACKKSREGSRKRKAGT